MAPSFMAVMTVHVWGLWRRQREAGEAVRLNEQTAADDDDVSDEEAVTADDDDDDDDAEGATIIPPFTQAAGIVHLLLRVSYLPLLPPSCSPSLPT